jgi:hypothetical protein
MIGDDGTRMRLILLCAALGSAPAFAADNDGDGVDASIDCNDTDILSFPGAPERCDGTDNDCDGRADEAGAVDASVWYRDSDHDDVGDAASPAYACAAPPSYVAESGDCDDSTGDRSPLAEEVCDGLDNDCDGVIDEEGATGGVTWYRDLDADNHGDPLSPVVDCHRPDDAVALGDDCDDTSAEVHPGAVEVWYDDTDQDCDANDDDQDGDGFSALDAGGDDCDDLDATVYPGAEETWYDGVDQDCAQDSDFDADDDGENAAAWGGTDCDDTDPATYPGAADIPYDGVVNDCAADDEYDLDRDGYATVEGGGTDCDDDSPAVNPGTTEVWYDGVDQDCDGNDDDQDADGYAADVDCDDEDALAFPDSPQFDADCIPLGRTARDGHLRGGGGCASVPGPRGGLGVMGLLAGLAALGRRRARR